MQNFRRCATTAYFGFSTICNRTFLDVRNISMFFLVVTFFLVRIMDYSEGLDVVFMFLGYLFTCQSVQNVAKYRVGTLEYVGNIP